FYFNFIYNDKFKLVSSSEFIEDVENDPIIIISGLSKAWRYSGWRVCWALGPKEVMESVTAVGSFLDGGANNPLQRAAIKLVNEKNILEESRIIQKVFRQKRDYMIRRLELMNIMISSKPEGAFYIWVNLENLPTEVNSGLKFFERMLKEKVVVVPGKFFDLDPHKSRKKKNFEKYVRFSYGPKIEILKRGLDRIENVLNKCK
ncbi:MAG: aminotransferase class I/II-fold pyridoxal phosphate-dependent enzyme, partial [Candidatus Pacebacteria bacterium]|nr:aminotransferase class I/II-fold pyridoxal phosphate-dependent enzyme [Candidatus Paceibacterota bacterium]